MTLAFQDVAGEVVVGGLLSGIDVDGGPTHEQLGVLSALGTHYLGCENLNLTSVPRIGPKVLAESLINPSDRRRFHHLHVALEAARHPQTSAQVAAVDAMPKH